MIIIFGKKAKKLCKRYSFSNWWWFDTTEKAFSKVKIVSIHPPWLMPNSSIITPLVFTRLLLDEIYHLIESLFDWLMIWCWFLFVYLLIWFEVFCAASWHWKPVDWDSYRLTSLYYKRTVLVIKTKILKLVFLEYFESRK